MAGAGPTTTTGGAAASSSGRRAGALARAHCVQSHGVPAFPNPSPTGHTVIQGGPNGGVNPQSAAFQRAQQECQKYSPQGHLTPAQQTQQRARLLKFSQCMRAHGITDFPDPGPTGQLALKAGPGSDLNPSSIPAPPSSRRRRSPASTTCPAGRRPRPSGPRGPAGPPAAADPFGGTAGTGALRGNAAPTSTATVARQTRTSTVSVAATLGYSGTYSIVNQAQGTLTSLPSVGQVVTQGQVLYRVGEHPVVLPYGAVPAYRDLGEGSTTALTGSDVQELNADLVALGYATATAIPPSTDTFTAATKAGVEALQASLGVAQTGTLTAGHVAFLPTAVRVTTLATAAVPGGSAPPGSVVMTATSTTRVVTISLDASQQSEVKVGDAVTITLPDHQTSPGVVSTVATAPASSTKPGTPSTPTVTVLVKPTDPSVTGTLDEAPVQVAVTTATAPHALVVPVNALLALEGGGYAVEVVGAGGKHSLVTVSLGIYDLTQGKVQVTGTSLAPGQRVVVPAT